MEILNLTLSRKVTSLLVRVVFVFLILASSLIGGETAEIDWFVQLDLFQI
jgi:hypothetical protein